MSILEELLSPIPFSMFSQEYIAKERPFAAPEKALFMKNCISWFMLQEILENRHSDCWLPMQGKLPEDSALNTGTLSKEQFLHGFKNNRTLLVRHAEHAHPVTRMIAYDFQSFFQCPIDLQVYCTPAQQEGFEWHYDLDDVFVIQTFGEKEFRLRKNTTTPRPLDRKASQREYFLREPPAPEIRCWLKAGDWLYIPAGYWHKAQAMTDSIHLSIGVHTTEVLQPEQNLHLY
nr:cupin domain-containing protein [uncultured Bdellovibrio sp.]